MSRLTWGALAERFYESGVDRGVLYVGTDAGVAWNGLISVTESPTGGEAKPAYIDGVKFRNIASFEEFEATIEAFSAPKEFNPCDGTAAIQNGLFITQQPRKRFNFSYRTRVGDAAQGAEAHYKIHLVYNALAAPSEYSHATASDSAEAASRSWSISTRAPLITGHKPTSHFVVDSRYTPAGILRYLEGLLYGTDSTVAQMPTVTALIDLFLSPGPIVARNLVTNPSVELNLANVAVGFGQNTFARDTVRTKVGTYSVKSTATGTGGCTLLWTVPTLVGNTYTFGLWAYSPAGTPPMSATAYFVSNTPNEDTKDDWVWMQHTFIATATSTQIGLSTVGATVVGQNMWADGIIMVAGEDLDGYFDGDTLDTDFEVFEWVGVPHASESIKRSLL